MFRRDGAGPLGLTLRFPHQLRWFALALAVSVPVVIIATGVLSGTVSFSLSAPGKPSLVAGVGAVLGFLLVKNTLEEFIFRGYATRTAMALGLPGIAPHLLVGAVWATWHLPLYLVWMSQDQYEATTTLPRAIYLPMLCLGALAVATTLGELRVQSGSIWPGVILHTLSGALAAPLLTDSHLTFRGHSDALFSPNANSIASTVAFGLVGIAAYRRRQASVGRRR